MWTINNVFDQSLCWRRAWPKTSLMVHRVQPVHESWKNNEKQNIWHLCILMCLRQRSIVNIDWIRIYFWKIDYIQLVHRISLYICCGSRSCEINRPWLNWAWAQLCKWLLLLLIAPLLRKNNKFCRKKKELKILLLGSLLMHTSKHSVWFS